jgi:hypothetical protein
MQPLTLPPLFKSQHANPKLITDSSKSILEAPMRFCPA